MGAVVLDRYEGILRKILEDEIAREKEGLASGAANDFADYQRRIGRIESLAKTIDFMDMARTDTFKD